MEGCVMSSESELISFIVGLDGMVFHNTTSAEKATIKSVPLQNGRYEWDGRHLVHVGHRMLTTDEGLENAIKRISELQMHEMTHLERVKLFMQRAGQETPDCMMALAAPPSAEIRRLRARLILEEALETVAALGCSVTCGSHELTASGVKSGDISIIAASEGSLVDVLDGLADLSVVSMGTVVAYGFTDDEWEGVLVAVDTANLRKFTGDGHRDANGKWIKPTGFVGPESEIENIIKEAAE
jgi:predicted HAD superfamily Cof-like phosphohydrolase